MQMLFHLLVGMMTCVLMARSGVAGVVYYVKPTTVCPYRDTHCPSGETCLKLDNYVNESSYYFSPDKVNITLYFICGMHNQTSEKHIDIHDLQTFAMLGVAANETVTIHMPVQSNKTLQTYTFSNVSNVTIETVTIISASIAIRGKTSMFIAHNAHFYGKEPYNNISKSTSFIILNGSQAFFENCTFQHNVFVKLYSRSTLLIKNCRFQSNCDDEHSAVSVVNSTVYLSASVYFGNNIVKDTGTVFFLIRQSVLEIFENANVTLIGNQAKVSGGAIYLDHSMIKVRKNTTLSLVNNRAAGRGGAIVMYNYSSIIFSNVTGYICNNTAGDQGGVIRAGSSSIYINHGSLYFNSNRAGSTSGACFIGFSSTFNITNQSTVIFWNNTVMSVGGALFIEQESNLVVNNANLKFYNNFAKNQVGGAIFLSKSHIYMREHAYVHFINNIATSQGGAIYLASGDINIDNQSVLIFANNSAIEGGALYLSLAWSLDLGNNSIIQFKNNSATKAGGALYGTFPQYWPCFLSVREHSIFSKVEFESNTASSGKGIHIYGGSTRSSFCTDTWLTLPYCGKDAGNINITFSPNLNNSLSPVSSDPKRVCLCDANGKPQCTELSKIFQNNIKVIPGESINISIVVVGQDFGATTGWVYAKIQKETKNDVQHSKYQWYLSRAKCLIVNYTVNATSSKDHEVLYLYTTSPSNKIWNQTAMENSISAYTQQNGCIDTNLLQTPVYFNISLLKCPKGFTFKRQQCHCFPVLINSHINCYLLNNKGYLQWSGSIWVGDKDSDAQESSNKILFSRYCPLSYCNTSLKTVELEIDPNAQCAFNRAGLLCGGCKENYSLAIGSSRCIKCSSNSYLALFIVFAAAGLVLLIFIFSLNLTVSQGLINGLVFYANIVWDYKIMLTYSSQPKTIMLPFRIFIAWLNLDFGVETCLVVGLTAFWKTWLQFLFPVYIWGIAGVIIIVCRYSTRLTNFIGDRAVPLLATLFYLSYMKLLRTVVSAFNLRKLTSYPSGSKITVWYLDGNLLYFKPPHIYLFVASLAASVFFCIPFTLFLLSVRWLRKISHLRPLRWINKFTPIYDACFAPLHDNHHQLFGLLLLIRGILLIILSIMSDSANPRTMNLLILFIVTVLLLLYVMFSKEVFKSYVVKILEGVSILNLCLLSFLAMYAPHKEIIITEVSIGFAVFQFFIIILISIIKTYCKTNNCCKCLKRRDQQAQDDVDEMYYERVEDHEINELMIDERNTVVTY